LATAPAAVLVALALRPTLWKHHRPLRGTGRVGTQSRPAPPARRLSSRRRRTASTIGSRSVSSTTGRSFLLMASVSFRPCGPIPAISIGCHRPRQRATGRQMRCDLTPLSTSRSPVLPDPGSRLPDVRFALWSTAFRRCGCSEMGLSRDKDTPALTNRDGETDGDRAALQRLHDGQPSPKFPISAVICG
jgi:hypothetical protein